MPLTGDTERCWWRWLVLVASQRQARATSTSRRFFLAPEFDSSTASPPRQRSLATDGDPGRRRYTPALPSTQGVVGPPTLSRLAVSFSSVRRSHASTSPKSA
jgi:hypothetical protein